MKGGGTKFTLMTFNVELLLELFKGHSGGFAEMITRETATFDSLTPHLKDDIKTKIDVFKRLFEGIDVACLQENVILPAADTGIYTNLLNHIGNLDIVASCHSHLFEWPISKQLYGILGKLSNSIYAKPAYIRKITLCDDACKIPTMNNTPRCFSEAILQIGDGTLRIASLHASGGRFDDIKALTLDSDTVVNTKIEQVRSVIETGSDIICGDFNTKLYSGETSNTDPYFKDLMKARFKIETGKADVVWNKEWDEEWNAFWSMNEETRWPLYETWMFGIDSVLKTAGYERAYGNEIGDTTLYGGTVDMVYYKPEKLYQVGKAERITDGVMASKDSGFPKYTPILSDHFPIKVQFEIK